MYYDQSTEGEERKKRKKEKLTVETYLSGQRFQWGPSGDRSRERKKGSGREKRKDKERDEAIVCDSTPHASTMSNDLEVLCPRYGKIGKKRDKDGRRK